MTVIVCVSDGGGMLFAKRRVSRDKAVIKDIAKLTESGALFVGEISESLFDEGEVSVIAVSNPLESADEGDFAFVEDRHIAEYADKITAIVIYRWNRKYLFDFRLDREPGSLGMKLVECTEFKGCAHEKITREIWKRG